MPSLSDTLSGSGDPFPSFTDWLGEQIGNEALKKQGLDPSYVRFLQHAQQAGGRGPLRLSQPPPVLFTATEHRILKRLMDARGKTVSRYALMSAIWNGRPDGPTVSCLGVYIHKIRKKLQVSGSNVDIENRHSVGWRLVTRQELKSRAA